VAGSDDLAERGTAEFYREQVARILQIAESLSDPAGRLELLDIASVFQKLADRASATTAADVNDASGQHSA